MSLIRYILDWDDDVEDTFDEAVLLELRQVLSRRYYLPRTRYRARLRAQFLDDLEYISPTGSTSNLSSTDESKNIPWLNRQEFIRKYRTTRSCFDKLVKLIEGHEVFQQVERRGRRQDPVAHQLMVLLHFLGSDSCSNSRLREIFTIGRGTAELYRNRVVTAIRSLRNKVITWPDEKEKRRISRRIYKKYGFPNCVGIVDGTLLPLAFKPARDDAPDFSGRKFGYSISTMVVCDDKRRIRHYLSGWAGSAHDNRVFDMSLHEVFHRADAGFP